MSVSSVTNLNAFDLYFYGALADAALKGKEQRVDRLLKASVGPKWREQLTELTAAYRTRVEGLLKEGAETSDARRAMDSTLTRVITWRRLVESVARQAPPERRRTLLQASGYGLGTPRSVKEMSDLLLEVKPRIELHGKELEALGLRPEAIKLPSEALTALEKGAADIARENAEDGQARDRVASTRTKLVDLLRSMELAVSAATAESELFGTEKEREEVTGLEIALAKALAESTVEARRKAQEQPVPADLLAAPLVVAESIED